MFQRMGARFKPGFKSLQKNIISMVSTVSKKEGDEVKTIVDESLNLTNSTGHSLKKGDQLISYDYKDKKNNPDHIGNHRFFASTFNLKNRFYYEIENGKKDNPDAIVLSKVKEDIHCTKELRKKDGQEIETFFVESDHVEPWIILKPK